MIQDGGVLISIPVEEWIQNRLKPDRSGQIVFNKKKEGGGEKPIESYPVGQTIDNINGFLRNKYEEKKKQTLLKSLILKKKTPQFQAVKAWQDANAKIKLKKALERMMVSLEIPTVDNSICQTSANTGLDRSRP